MKKIRDAFRKIFQYSIVFLWIGFILLPVFSIFIGSFKVEKEFYTTFPLALPEKMYLGNYIEVFNGDFFQSALTTSVIILITVLLTSLMSSMIAYSIERFEYKYKKSLINLLLVVSLIPMIVMQIFVFQVLNKLHLYDTILGVSIIYSISDIVIIYIFREQIRKIPTSIDKSAIINGASYIQIYFNIILPSVKEAIMVVIMLKTIAIYNDFYTQFLYLPTKTTVSMHLYNFVGKYSIGWPEICATIIVSLIPIVIITLITQLSLKNKISYVDLK